MQRLLFLCLVILPLAAFTAHAREGFFVGGGFASVSASGDLKGAQFVTNTSGTEAEVLGSLSSGSGIDLELGYGFNEYIGIEYLGAGTTHTATTNKNIIPVSDTKATVGTALIALRLTAPVAKSFELFARLGLAGSSVTYAEYSVPGSTAGTTFTPSGTGGPLTLSGTGSGYGAGFEVFGDHLGFELGVHLGFELSYNVLNVTFNQAKGVASSGTLPKSQKEQFTVTTAIVLYHF